MNISCEVIKDLLPLYHDDVCNASSKKLVDDHLAGCADCAAMLEKIKSSPLDERIKKERESVIRHHTQAVRKKMLTVGVTIASVLTIPVLVSLIVNIAVGQALDWFFIVLTSLMLTASITVVPLVFEKNKGLWTLGTFTASLLLLLGTIAIYSSGSWFFVAAIPSLVGLSILFSPYVLSKLPLKGFAARHKGLLSMTINTVLLCTVIIVSGLFAQSGASFFGLAFLITAVCLFLPWALFLIIRYLRASVMIKAGLCFISVGLFSFLLNDMLDRIIMGAWQNRISFIFDHANLFIWQGQNTINANITLLILLVNCIVGGVLVAIGLLKKRQAASKAKG